MHVARFQHYSQLVEVPTIVEMPQRIVPWHVRVPALALQLVLARVLPQLPVQASLSQGPAAQQKIPAT